MHIFKQVADIQQFLNEAAQKNVAIGFVPTMGALHQGHLSLVETSKRDNAITVVSIFVNPTQFNDPKDLEKYPRTVPDDLKKLINEGVEVAFLPAPEGIYPSGKPDPIPYDFGSMVTHMEGAHRPGHFDGVIQVVKRLLEIVQPTNLYMGQKDYQQQAICGQLIEFMGIPTQLHTCPIIREPDGLAMSSRNVHLNDMDRQRAIQISKTLFQAQVEAQTLDLETVRQNAIGRLDHPWFSVDYLEFVDAKSLEPVADFNTSKSVVLCTTVRIGGIRLLDNVILF
ncbi:MAG: pantoate--beta-alanine ligase [Bacteroidota bacterium]